MNRNARKKLAEETVAILEAGEYNTASGNSVRIASEIKKCVENTALFSSDELQQLVQASSKVATFDGNMRLTVANETALDAARRLKSSAENRKVCVLNFASAMNPGGGFLSGSQAQEESLARNSALYASLNSRFEYYEHHRKHDTPTYSDRMLYSPDCVVFRDDSGALLDKPYEIDIITSPAPNAGKIQNNTPELIPEIPQILQRRASKVLALASSKNCQTLILGAWGCGVFANDPSVVAGTFGSLLKSSGDFAGHFESVHFAAFDPSKEQAVIRAFSNEFA